MPSITCCLRPHGFTSFELLKKSSTCICNSQSPALLLGLDPGSNFYLMATAPNLYFMVSVLNLCLPVLRFALKVYYSYSVYLYKPQSQERERVSVSYDMYRLLSVSSCNCFEISSQDHILFICIS